MRSDVETLVDLLRTSADAYGGRTAVSIRMGLREDAWSYARLWTAANAVARHLRQTVGLRPGDRVVVWAPNGPYLVACYFGAMLARLVLVPLDPYATPEFIARVVEKTEAALLITGFAKPDACRARVERLADLPYDAAVPAFGEHPTEDEVAEIVFTSGTTGDPKGVVLTHGNIVANVRSARILVGRARFRLLSVLPLSHMLEQTVGLYLPLLDGATIFYPAGRQSSALAKTLRRHRVEAMIVVPRVLSLMLEGIEREVARTGRVRRWRWAHRLAERLPMTLRRWLFWDVHQELGGHLGLVICGGASLPPDLGAAWERIGVKVVEGYGATECAPIVAANTPGRRILGTVGRPAPGVRVRLSAAGEILVKGANVTPGYWRDEVATRSAFTEDGWFRTGDLGELDEQAYLRLTGRLKDLIVLPSGLKVHPEDVERELRRENGVADCVVVGTLEATGKPSVHAVVIPTGGEADAEVHRQQVSQAIRNANTRLAPHQRIDGCTLWETGDFPRTNLQKVKRHEVLLTLAGEAPRSRTVSPLAPTVDDRFSRLRRLLARVGDTASEVITPVSDLSLDLHLDSLSRVELAVLVEEEFGVALQDGDLTTVNTVAQLLALIDAGETTPPANFPRWSLRRPARVARTVLQCVLLLPLHRLVCRPFRVEGREHLRARGSPLLLIANHSSHVDSPSILRALPWRIRRRVAVAAAADYFYRTRRSGLLPTLLLNTFPFSREGSVRSSLEYCGELADRGWSILVYPEGTRSPTGKLLPFRSGIGLLAAELRLPVVPIALQGGHEVLPKGHAWPRPGPFTVRIGTPIFPSQSREHAATAALLERAVASLMDPPGPDRGHERPAAPGQRGRA